MAVKYVFVTGGVVSGLGKGITAASLGRLLKARGYNVTMQKFDPYLNVDPGTKNPPDTLFCCMSVIILGNIRSRYASCASLSSRKS